MAPRAIDYSKMVMYKIVCKDLDVLDLYVGSNFRMRKNSHKSCCNNLKSDGLQKYETINANGGWENWDMVLIEGFPCENGDQARAREHYWYEALNSSINTKRPICCPENYGGFRREYVATYRATNMDKIAKGLVVYRAANVDIIAQRRAEYRTTNRGIIAQRRTEYYQRKKQEKLSLAPV